MPSNHYDVIVIGVGSMGAAACWYLAKRDYKVLGLEQFDIPHEQGSHAGKVALSAKPILNTAITCLCWKEPIITGRNWNY